MARSDFVSVELWNKVRDLDRMLPDGIFVYLDGLNIKGRRYNPYYCPIAQYLDKVVYPDGYAETTGIEIQINDCIVIFDAPNLCRFIQLFDRGAYPDLERK